MAWIFGITGLLLGWVLAAWLSGRACEARVREVEAGWSNKLAQGDQAFATRLRDQEANFEADRQRIEQEWAAKLAAREVGWKNRLESQESDLKTQIEDLDAKFANQRREEAVRTPIRPTDRLTLINGIGKKTSEVLASAGIMTFWSLANTTVDHINTLLEDAGSNFRNYDPSSWPAQARLLAEGRTDALTEFQEWLKDRV